MVHSFISISEQAKLSFASSKPLSTSAFRKALSRWLCSSELLQPVLPEVAAMFQRTPDGKRINASALIRFEASAHECHVWAVGRTSEMLLHKVYGLCQQLSSTRPAYLGPCSMQRSSTGVQLKASVHRAAQLVVCKNAQQFALWSASDPSAKAQHIASILQAGLHRQLKALESDSPPCIEPSLLQPRDIHILHEWSAPKLEDTSSKAYLRLAHITFELPCTLMGSWAAGMLNNKGYGLIHATSST